MQGALVNGLLAILWVIVVGSMIAIGIAVGKAAYRRGWTGTKSTFVAMAVLVSGLAVGAIGTTLLEIARIPVAVVEKVTTPDNIVYNYKHFWDLAAIIRAYPALIENFKKEIEDFKAANASPTVPGALNPSYAVTTALKSMYDSLTAARNVMASTVQQYNADALNLTSGAFKDWRLPKSFEIQGDTLKENYEN